MQTVTTIGLDIAKSVFQVHGVDQCKDTMRAFHRGQRAGMQCERNGRGQGQSGTGTPTIKECEWGPPFTFGRFE